MIPRIDEIQNFNQRLAGIERIRQRIAEIEKQIGINNSGGEDFQTILNRELAKSENVNSTQKVNSTNRAERNQIEKQSVNENSEIEGTRTLPGEEALPDSIRQSLNPYAAINSSPSAQSAQNENLEEEEITTPTRETKRLSFNANLSTEDMIEDAALKYNVDSKLVRAVAIAESNMNQDDISDAGAIGVMQLMPETAAGLGVDPYDEQQNIEGGAKYLRQMLDTFGGNVKKAVAAYNAGPGAVQRYGGIPPYSETQNYVGRVMDLYR